MKKTKFFQRMLDNNHFVLVLSLIISISIWVYMSFGTTNDTTLTITDIPIQIELSETAKKLGLQVFTSDTPKAEVTISGNRTILGLVTKADLNVVAAASDIDIADKYTLPVSVSKKNLSGSFQISRSTPSSVTVVVDYYKESTFQLQDNVVFYLKDGYYGTTSLSTDSLTVSGPQSEILKIKKIVARANINGKLSESTKVEATPVFLDENDNELSTQLFELSENTVQATINVLPEKTVQLKASYDNKPSYLDITEDMIKIEPGDILIAGPQDVLDSVTKVSLEKIDFSKLDNRKISFENLAINLPDGCKSIGNDTTADVTLDLSGFDKRTFTIDNFTVNGLSGEYESKVTQKSLEITVIGDSNELDRLNVNDIEATIDTSEIEGKTGSVQMPVSFRILNKRTCWVYGNYQANLTITEKQ